MRKIAILCHSVLSKQNHIYYNNCKLTWRQTVYTRRKYTIRKISIFVIISNIRNQNS